MENYEFAFLTFHELNLKINWLKPQEIMNSKNYLQIVFEGTNRSN